MTKHIEGLHRMGYIKSGDSVLDCGALNVNGTYRKTCEELGLAYSGQDIVAGPNVDLVVPVCKLPKDSYELVISGQMLEHCDDLSRVANEMVTVCRPRGWCIWIAPNEWGEHHRPDRWRILRDGMSYLMRNLTKVETYMEGNDTVGLGQKP